MQLNDTALNIEVSLCQLVSLFVLSQRIKVRGIRGLVVEGVYHRHQLAGDREHHIPHPHQPDGEHLAGGRKPAGGQLKRQPRTHSGVGKERPTRRRQLTHETRQTTD